MTKHDPERNASLFLGGMMSGRARRRFEQHIIGCENCWREVELGRRGRTLAESSRELAPQELREMIRSTVAATPLPGRGPISRKRLGVLAASTAVAFVLAFVVLQPPQPQEIEVLLADYDGSEQLHRGARATLPPILGDLKLEEVRRGRVEEMSVVVHEYSDPAGHVVTIYQSDYSFPDARGAEHSASMATWSVRLDGTVMFCADEPVPSLVIGDDEREVRLATAELELR